MAESQFPYPGVKTVGSDDQVKEVLVPIAETHGDRIPPVLNGSHCGPHAHGDAPGTFKENVVKIRAVESQADTEAGLKVRQIRAGKPAIVGVFDGHFLQGLGSALQGFGQPQVS